MEILGLVPARGGSKGIPGKNLAQVGGRTLLERACAAGLASETVTRVVVSTDSEEIAEAAAAAGAEVPFLRPEELSRDETPMLEVLVHALDALGDPDGVVLLQPTSPLRRASHVDEAVRLWRETGADSVVSVVRVPHAFNPTSLLQLAHGRLEPASDAVGPSRRQDKPPLYARNGPAILVVRPAVLRGGSLYGDDSRPYEMAFEDSIDVDGPFELELADLLAARRERS